MSPEVLAALRGSIEKWQGIVDGTVEDRGPMNCPLCLMFNPSVIQGADRAAGCAGCPVKLKTGHDFCD